MIYLLTAMFHEASALIQPYQLKKETDIHPFQTFSGDKARLIISGTGAVNASVAAAFLCTRYPPAAGDLFINLGICGGDPLKYQKGELVLANRLLDETTGRFYYPDMLFRHPFPEDGLCSAAGPRTASPGFGCGLADMEGAFVFQAVSHFVSPDRILIVKTVTDYFEPEQVSKEKIRRILTDNAPMLRRWLDGVHAASTESAAASDRCIVTKRERKAMDNLAVQLKLTASMRITLDKHLKYFKLRNEPIGKHSRDTYAQTECFADEACELLEHYTRLGCRDKMEGKKLYAQLLQQLMD